ncbi:MAG TPA: DUF424 family protein [Terriglobales bacterium]|nr:DUF424 family protein [Terriglobales bacterium]
MAEVLLKVFRDAKYTMVAACDPDLLGSTFREGKLKLEVKQEFYQGSRASISDALAAINTADVANLVGRTIIEAAIQKRLVDPTAIVHISGVPHVQIVRM